MPLEVGTTAPEFTLVSQNRERISLDDLKGKKSMIVFMPYPHTRTCEAEACEIRDNWASFEGVDAHVVMITTHAGPPTGTGQRKTTSASRSSPTTGPMARCPGRTTPSTDVWLRQRTTYILDSEGVIRDVIASDVLG